MRRFLIWGSGILLLVILVGAGLFLRTLSFAGQLVEVQPHFAGTCKTVEGIVGAEDLDIDHTTGMAYLSAYDRRAVDAGEMVSGALYRYDVNDPDAQPELLWRGSQPGDFRPHGISLYHRPEGLRLFVINHPADGRHLVEIFDVDGTELTHVDSISDPLIASPNDLVAVGNRAFYVGNDIVNPPGPMQLAELLIPLAQAKLIYYDGGTARVAAQNLAFANGVAVSPDGTTLYVAEMMGKALRIYERDTATNAISLIETVKLRTFMDNINVDPDGNLWIGAHPRLFDIMQHMQDPMMVAPAQVIKATPRRNGGGSIDEVYLNRGNEISAVSAVAAYGGKMLLGPIYDPKFLVCDLPEPQK